MTKAEHTKAYRAARSATARRVIDGKRQIRREYLRVIAKIATVIRGNRSKLFLEEQIRAAFPRKELFDRLMKLVLEGRADTARLVADIEKRYIFEALDKVPGHGLSKDKITALFDAKIERTKIANSKPYLDVARNAKEKTYTGTGFAYRPEGKWKGTRFDYTFRQSHSLSKSVWDAVNNTEEKILDTVWGGISQGRDIKTVAADLMAYAHGGPHVLPGRWGKLEPGTREYVKRLGKQGIDYRAMRLYRSEKYRHLQEAAVEDGESNPACTGEYDWILMPGRENWNCDCPDIAAAGPYKADTIPPYRHPNCFLKGTKVLTANGEKPIEKIILGELVLCGDGKLHRVIGKMKSKYKGPIYRLQTGSRKSGWSTFNHSYKSGDGGNGRWVSAESLNKGDNIFSVSRSASDRLPGETIAKNNPSPFNKKRRFCVVMDYFHPGIMPITAVYLNGKFYIGEGKVDIVNSFREIWNGSETEFYKFLIHSGFIHRTDFPFIPFGAFFPVCLGSLHSANSGMSRFCVWLISVMMRSMLAVCKSGFFKTKRTKTAINDGTGHAEPDSHLIYREALFFKENGDSFPADIICFHDTILSKIQSQYNGFVWNITVEGEHNYFANGFLVKNCDCMIEPRMKDHDEFIQQLRDYANGEDTPGAHEIEEWAMTNDLEDLGAKSTGFDWDQKLKESIERGAHSEWEARRIGELAYAKAHRENKTIYDILMESREFGPMEEHSFSAGSNFAVDQWVKDVMRCFPTKWLNASAKLSADKPVTTVFVTRMNFYDKNNALFGITSPGTKAVHELAHRMQHAMPIIREYEAEFYKRRTKGEALIQLSAFQKYAKIDGADKFWTRLDKFKDPYMGVDYRSKNRYEIFTTGIEDLWYNTYNADKEYLNFIVGILLGV